MPKGVKGKHTPYWYDVLYNLAPKRQEAGKDAFTNEEKDRAREWTTCACGRQDDGIPREPKTGAPIDPELVALGAEFDAAVFFDSVGRARKTLAAIERRSAIVLRESLEASRCDANPKDGHGGAA